MSYSDLLRDPRWQRKRLKVMERADFACEICGDSRSTLNVHHIQYVRGRLPWEYDTDELYCLCERCHARQHPDKTAEPEHVSAILPRVILSAWAADRPRHSAEWRAVLARLGVVDRYDPAVCIVCHGPPRADLTRCAACRALGAA